MASLRTLCKTRLCIKTHIWTPPQSSTPFFSVIFLKPLKTYSIFHTCMPAFSVPRLFCCVNDMTSLRHFQLIREIIATSICNAFCLLSLICTLPHPHSSLQIISPHLHLFVQICQSLGLIGRTTVSKGMELPIGIQWAHQWVHT